MTDQGTAYELPPPTHDGEVTEVRSDTPMGELLRRHWRPIGLINDTTDTLRPVRALVGDLVLFRDSTGHPRLGPVVNSRGMRSQLSYRAHRAWCTGRFQRNWAIRLVALEVSASPIRHSPRQSRRTGRSGLPAR